MSEYWRSSKQEIMTFWMRKNETGNRSRSRVMSEGTGYSPEVYVPNRKALLPVHILVAKKFPFFTALSISFASVTWMTRTAGLICHTPGSSLKDHGI